MSLRKIADRESHNKMVRLFSITSVYSNRPITMQSSYNLALLMSPNLFFDNSDLGISDEQTLYVAIVQSLIDHADRIGLVCLHLCC